MRTHEPGTWGGGNVFPARALRSRFLANGQIFHDPPQLASCSCGNLSGLDACWTRGRGLLAQGARHGLRLSHQEDHRRDRCHCACAGLPSLVSALPNHCQVMCEACECVHLPKALDRVRGSGYRLGEQRTLGSLFRSKFQVKQASCAWICDYPHCNTSPVKRVLRIPSSQQCPPTQALVDWQA